MVKLVLGAKPTHHQSAGEKMATNGGGQTTTPNFQAAAPPKILLAKPSVVVTNDDSVLLSSSSRGGGGGGGSSSSHHHHNNNNIIPSSSSSSNLNLLSLDSWDFNPDRFLPFLTDNTDFTVVGIIGPPGVGKSTILNHIYAASDGMLPPFDTQSEDTRAMARHCTVGIEPRVSPERIILLDTQPVYSPSVLADMIRPDGSSTIPILGGEHLSAELAHEVMCIQLAVLLASICHIIIVVTEGVHDINMWRLMSTVDLLKHNIPDPSSITLSHPQSSNLVSDKESKDKIQELGEEYMSSPVFVHTKLHGQDLAPQISMELKKALNRYFRFSSFMKIKCQNSAGEVRLSDDPDSLPLKSFFIPSKCNNDSSGVHYESYLCRLWKLRDQVLSMSAPSFSRTVSERDWLKNSAKIWDLVKNSSTISDFSKTLQNSGMFRK